MIVPMKKVTLVCMEAAREMALEQLRGLGVMHLEPVTPPAGADIDALKNSMKQAEAIVSVLEGVGRAARIEPGADTGDGMAILQEVGRLLAQRKDVTERMDRLGTERKAAEPMGDFDPTLVGKLKAAGVYVKLCYVPGKGQPDGLSSGVVCQLMGHDTVGHYFVLVGRGDFEFKAQAVDVPPRSLSSVNMEWHKAEDERVGLERHLETLAGHRASARSAIAGIQDQIRFAEARAGMGVQRALSWLKGFCPADEVEKVRGCARQYGWGLVIEDPGEAEMVPTLLRNPAPIKPIKAVLDMLGILPGYRELDVSTVFLIFFSVFFAMLIGDAGYGFIFLGLTGFLRFKLGRKAPPNLIPLLGILSCTTILWGALSGAWFSIQDLPVPLARIRIDWLGPADNMMRLCFLIGATHITVAHAWNFFRTVRTSLTSLAQLGWIFMAWTMYYVACNLVMESAPAVPGFVKYLFGVGTVLVFVFSVPLKALKTEGVALIMMPLSIINAFGDTVSYLRLYLVGSASVTLIVAFNEMVKGMAEGEGFRKFVMTLVVALIIFAAHVLNIILGGLAVLVHGIRLNALEFSSHIGIQWAGFCYKPFAKVDGKERPDAP